MVVVSPAVCCRSDWGVRESMLAHQGNCLGLPSRIAQTEPRRLERQLDAVLLPTQSRDPGNDTFLTCCTVERKIIVVNRVYHELVENIESLFTGHQFGDSREETLILRKSVRLACRLSLP